MGVPRVDSEKRRNAVVRPQRGRFTDVTRVTSPTARIRHGFDTPGSRF